MTVLEDEAGLIEIVQPGTGLCIELELREDRSAEWSFSGGDGSEPGNSALETAAMVNRLLPCSAPETR